MCGDAVRATQGIGEHCACEQVFRTVLTRGRTQRPAPQARVAPPTPAGGGVNILVAVVAGSSIDTQRRTLRNMRSVDDTYDSHKARLDWAVSAYDDGAERWADVLDAARALRHVRLITVRNASINQSAPLAQGQRKARMVHHISLVEGVWKDAGKTAYDAVWLPDDDLQFDRFDLQEFLFRWRYAYAGGWPVVSQPPIDQHGKEFDKVAGKTWPNNGAPRDATSRL